MKDLTVQQKVYMTKRIDTITTEKLETIENDYRGKIHLRTGGYSGLDFEAAEGILAGKVKLNAEGKILKVIADRLKVAKEALAEAEIARAAGRYYGSSSKTITLGTFDFVDKDAVAAYHKKFNKEARRLADEKYKRRTAVTTEATKVKDSVILEGSSAAIALLEKFANKKF